MKFKFLTVVSLLVTTVSLVVTFVNYQTISKLKADQQVISDRLARKSNTNLVTNQNKATTSQPTGTPTVDNSFKITSQNSAYASDTQSGKLVNLLTESLTYSKGSDLRQSFDKNKNSLTGSIWRDVYGKLKSTGEPAINAFASEIDTLKKTSKVSQVNLTKNLDGTYMIILTVTQGGDKASGAVNGSSIYQIQAKPTESGFETTLLNILTPAS